MRMQLKASMVLLLLNGAALAQEPRTIKTAPGRPVALSFLLNETADCHIGPVGLPRLTQAPSNGSIEMSIALSNVPALGTCAAHQVPTIALVYVPNAGFVGTDAVTIEVKIAGRDVEKRYQITVQ